MIFYEVEKFDGHYLVATQADAKREAREQKCTWAQVDIPTDKQGLMEYINAERRVDRLGAEERDEAPVEPPAPKQHTIREAVQWGGDAEEQARLNRRAKKMHDGVLSTDLTDFILDEAEGSVLANIIGAAAEKLQRLEARAQLIA